ncbi:MAG TPA: molybdenum cofactor biosynthesis protein MoaE [Terriglobales bacterium]|jgi:molybdopterin converting factor subunit 1|nr:molybdenum cofactor biosynthesis protein MoaE [Terriglobales bacterium]
MQVRVLFFGILKDLTGYSSDLLELPEHATLRDLLAHYQQQIPRLSQLASSLAMSINQEYAPPESSLKSGDEVALLPPVSGGSGQLNSVAEPTGHSRYAAIVERTIDTQALLAKIKQPVDGAAVVFEGVVRNHSRGRRTLYLDYEAYSEMAVKQMELLAQQALSKFPIRDIAIEHRLGRLQIGETSVAIVVASAHRAAAFEACRWLIDTLKRTVPIWKREYFEDGAVWADGEPFPPEIPRGEGSHSGKPASK